MRVVVVGSRTIMDYEVTDERGNFVRGTSSPSEAHGDVSGLLE